jgi:hypothetical protein
MVSEIIPGFAALISKDSKLVWEYAYLVRRPEEDVEFEGV